VTGILFRHFFELALRLITERDPLLLDTSILYALYPLTYRDAAIRDRVIDLLRKGYRVYVPDLALLEARENALSRGKSHQEAIEWVRDLFRHAEEVIFPLGVGRIDIIATEPDDLSYYPPLRFYDSTILTIGARRGFYVITTERNLRYFRFAKRVGAKVINDCLWYLAKYYFDRIADRYVRDRTPDAIVRWISERDHRIKRWEERYRTCVRG